MNETFNITTYIVGWLLFVWLQAHNSTLSKTNSLPSGWAGYKLWLQAHAAEIAVRGFFSAIGYAFIIHSIATTVQHIGFQATAIAINGVAGFSANTLCYQFMGLFPGLRAEVADLAPPANSQVVPAGTTSQTPTPNPQSSQSTGGSQK
jgi:hypothetical protein